MHPQQFPYPQNPEHPGSLGLPYAPITLFSRQTSLQRQALLDSGAMVNVLPYSVGLELGAPWEKTPPLQLTGNLAAFPAYAIKVETQVGDFAPLVLTFAWTQNDQVPIIFGLINFFLKFNVCFFASERVFEIIPCQQ